VRKIHTICQKRINFSKDKKKSHRHFSWVSSNETCVWSNFKVEATNTRRILRASKIWGVHVSWTKGTAIYRVTSVRGARENSGEASRRTRCGERDKALTRTDLGDKKDQISTIMGGHCFSENYRSKTQAGDIWKMRERETTRGLSEQRVLNCGQLFQSA